MAMPRIADTLNHSILILTFIANRQITDRARPNRYSMQGKVYYLNIIIIPQKTTRETGV
jgi:hypothetical protein